MGPSQETSSANVIYAGVASSARATICRSPLGTFAECPLCGGTLAPEHAHFRCRGCGWRDSCCD